MDFDKAEWREDATAFVRSCHELDVPVALEISRSGNGAHAWIFFTTAVPARDARRLGTAIISHTCSRTRQLSLTSYDRLFPNQDTMPKGGFGNLGRSCASMRPRHLCILYIVALPLQKKPRDAGHSVFVDDKLRVYPDQWAFLASVEPMSPIDIEAAILRATSPTHPLDVTFIDNEDLATPWKRPVADKATLPGPFPDALAIPLANLVYFEKAQLTQPLTNRLIRLAAFQNPEFYRAQAMRLSVWDKTAGLPFCTAKPPAGRGPRMARVTSPGSSAVLRTSPNTLVFHVAAWTPRRNCFEATASAATYMTNG